MRNRFPVIICVGKRYPEYYNFLRIEGDGMVCVNDNIEEMWDDSNVRKSTREFFGLELETYTLEEYFKWEGIDDFELARTLDILWDGEDYERRI